MDGWELEHDEHDFYIHDSALTRSGFRGKGDDEDEDDDYGFDERRWMTVHPHFTLAFDCNDDSDYSEDWREHLEEASVAGCWLGFVYDYRSDIADMDRDHLLAMLRSLEYGPIG